MASKERHNLTSLNHERVAALARKTTVLMEDWRRERGARLAAQLAVNTEIKQRWLDSNLGAARQTSAQVTFGTDAKTANPCAPLFFPNLCNIER